MKKKIKKEKMDWLDEEIEFYDFIWREGVSACGKCINKELLGDFAAGGDKFEMMKMLIRKKFPTREDAIRDFSLLS